MSSNYVAPSLDRKSFNCPHCGAFADQSWFVAKANPVATDDKMPSQIRRDIEEFAAKEIEKGGESSAFWEKMLPKLKRIVAGEVVLSHLDDAMYVRYELDNVHVSRCFSCREAALWLHTAVVYPVGGFDVQPNADLDEAIKKDFREASGIAAVSPRGAAALLRLCVQKMMIQVGQPGRNVNDDVAALVQAGLDARLQKALDIVRITGNNAVHPGQISNEDTAAIVSELFNIVNTIADALISQPRRIEEIYSGLPQSAIDAIQRRDGQE